MSAQQVHGGIKLCHALVRSIIAIGVVNGGQNAIFGADGLHVGTGIGRKAHDMQGFVKGGDAAIQRFERQIIDNGAQTFEFLARLQKFDGRFGLAFSDGVGYNWIDTLKEVAAQQVTDLELEKAAFRFPINTPMTKEAYFYRTIFQNYFPGDEPAKTVPGGKSVACSTPEALAWDKSLNNVIDPSGRAVQQVHIKSY